MDVEILRQIDGFCATQNKKIEKDEVKKSLEYTIPIDTFNEFNDLRANRDKQAEYLVKYG